MEIEAKMFGPFSLKDLMGQPPKNTMDPEAQWMELEDRFACYQEKEVFSAGQRVYEKRGMTLFKASQPTMFWRYLKPQPLVSHPSIQSINDAEIIRAFHQRSLQPCVDCIVAAIGEGGEYLTLSAIDSRTLTALPPEQQPGAREDEPAT